MCSRLAQNHHFKSLIEFIEKKLRQHTLNDYNNNNTNNDNNNNNI